MRKSIYIHHKEKDGWFKRFVLLCLFAIPFAPQGVGVYLGGGLPIIDVPRIILATLLVLWGARLAVKRRISMRRSVATIAFILLIATQFLSIFVSGNPRSSLIYGVGFFVYYYAIYFVLISELKTVADCEKALVWLVLLGVALGLLSIVEFGIQEDLYRNYRTAWVSADKQYRHEMGRIVNFRASFGPYGASLPFAYLLIGLFFLVLNYQSRDGKRWFEQWRFAVLMLIGIGVVFTQSRAAILSGIIIYVISMAWRQRGRFRVVFASMVGLGCVAYVVYLLGYSEYFSSFLFSTDFIYGHTRAQDGLLFRLEDNLSALSALMSRPLLGHGMGAYLNNRYVDSDLVINSDWGFLMVVGVENGLFAGIAVSTLIASTLFSLLRTYRREKDVHVKNLIYTLFWSILAFVVVYFSSARMESSFVFFALLGIANVVTTCRHRKGSYRPQIPQQRGGKLNRRTHA